MSRATDLADRLDETCRAFAVYLEGLSPEQWRTRCENHPTIRVGDEDENRPVGTVAHHVVTAMPRQLAMLRQIVAGEEVARPSAARAAEHAAANPDPDRAQTVPLLRANAADLVAAVRRLSDEDLARTGMTMLGEATAATVVDRVLIGHVRWHEESIRATLHHPGA